MRYAEFAARTGVNDTVDAHRLTKDGVLDPDRVGPPGRGRTVEYSEDDVVAACVYLEARKSLTPAAARAAARQARTGEPFVVVFASGAIACPTLEFALAAVNVLAEACTLIAVANIVRPATAAEGAA